MIVAGEDGEHVGGARTEGCGPRFVSGPADLPKQHVTCVDTPIS